MYKEDVSNDRKFFVCTKKINLNETIHLHRAIELIYVEKGNVTIISTCGTEKIEKGQYALIMSNCIHSYKTQDSSVVYCCNFSSDLGPPFVRKSNNIMADRTVFNCKDSINRFVKTELFNEQNVSDWYIINACLYAVLGEFRKQVGIEIVSETGEDLIKKIFHYIEENFTKTITFENMAHDLKYEKNYLSKYMHKYIPYSFTYLVNWYRVDMATDLLKNTDLSVSEIAMRSGFQSIRSFNRVYMNIIGKTPTQVAKRRK